MKKKNYHQNNQYLQEKEDRTQQQELTLNTSSLSPHDIHSLSLPEKTI
jgi:hypothetical protein